VHNREYTSIIYFCFIKGYFILCQRV
jgi:hypothetical protein